MNEALEAWLKWAKGKADWLDPLVAGPDEWLEAAGLNLSQPETPPDNQHPFYRQSLYDQAPAPERQKSWPLLPWYNKT